MGNTAMYLRTNCLKQRSTSYIFRVHLKNRLWYKVPLMDKPITTKWLLGAVSTPIYIFSQFPHWPWGSTALYGDNACFHKNSRLKQSLNGGWLFWGFVMMSVNGASGCWKQILLGSTPDQALQYNQINRHFENTDESFYKWMAGD